MRSSLFDFADGRSGGNGFVIIYTKLMSRLLRHLFTLILIFSSYHLLRDILQIIGINILFANILHREHLWCKPFCDLVTLPPDILGITGSLIVLKRNSIGSLGVFLILMIPLWLLAVLLPWRNYL